MVDMTDDDTQEFLMDAHFLMEQLSAQIDKLQQAFAGGMFVLILALVIIFFRI